MSNSRSNDITTGQADSGGLWVSEDMRQMFKQSRPNVSASTWVSTMRPAVDHHTKVKLNKALNPPAHAETPASTPVIRLRRDG